MSKLEVNIYKTGEEKPENQISMPLSVLRLNPRLLPANIAKVLESQGIEIAELASLDGVDGTILDISGSSSRIVVSINSDKNTPVIDETPSVKVQIPVEEPTEQPPVPEPVAEKRAPTKNLSSFQQRLTTEFIAKEIGWRTGHDLIYAACAHMHIVYDRKEWDSEEIDTEIKAASNYYKPFYSTNLREYLQYLMKNGKLFMNDRKKFALTPATVKYLEDRLSEEKIKKRV